MIMDCAIVRTMKASRTMKYNDLVAQITPQIRLFPFDIAHLKIRLEALIVKEYLTREKDIYKYVTA